MKRILGFCLAAFLMPPFHGAAQATTRQQEAKSVAAETAPPKEESSVTEHSIRLGGQVIPYKATAETILLKNENDEPIGLMYGVAYTRSDVTDLASRPIAFLYNGGPGSASMWLHMGAFGPRRVWTVDAAFTPPARYRLVDNTESLLDKTDLVFIDAMGTGYSYAVGEAQNKDFYGIDEDVQAFAKFINTYINRSGRWNSPKFLIGESYGTFRSAALGNYLQQHYSMHLNGIVLISSALDTAAITFGVGDDRPYVYYLPTYAAIAWYHKVLRNRPSDLAAFVEEARQYAQHKYASALFSGSKLTVAEKGAVARRLSYFTGLSEDYLIKADLRVTPGQFSIELQRARGLTTGRNDARFSGYTRDLLAETAQGDPEGPAVAGAFTAMLNAYNHDELKFGLDKDYHNSSRPRQWNWVRRSAGFERGIVVPAAPNIQGDLTQAMITNPRLYVEVESGYYDCNTPFLAAEYRMHHLGLPADLQSHVQLKYYPSGHMIYLDNESRVQLHNNIAAFIDRATQAPSK